MTATDLVAEDATEGYVLLQAKDQKKDDAQLYVVVDTTYYGGTETDGSLLTYTYDAYGPKNDDGSLRIRNLLRVPWRVNQLHIQL